MADNVKILTLNNNKIIDEYGNSHTPPAGWSFLPAGSAGVTRKVTKHKHYWRIQIKKGKRTISKGIWAPDRLIKDAIKEDAAQKQSPEYAKKREYSAKRRELKQQEYQMEFFKAIASYLNFHLAYKKIEIELAKRITVFATPIGSGTVARTQMIPIEQRAEKAVIAWLRHNTTEYDNLQIPKIKGERRNIRRQLAQRSVILLGNYRQGKKIPISCPLYKALSKATK